jgi:hypothetical protein
VLKFDGDFNGSHISFTDTLDPDPVINYAIGVTNNAGVTQTYSFVIQTPVVNTDYSEARGALSVTLTDNPQLLDGISAGANGGLAFARGLAGLGVAGTNLGVDRGFLPTNGPVPCSAGPGTGGAICDYGLAVNLFPATNFNVLRSEIDFTLTPNGDNAAFTGNLTLLTGSVAEPSAVMLVAGGLLSLVGAVRIRRRAA